MNGSKFHPATGLVEALDGAAHSGDVYKLQKLLDSPLVMEASAGNHGGGSPLSATGNGHSSDRATDEAILHAKRVLCANLTIVHPLLKDIRKAMKRRDPRRLCYAVEGVLRQDAKVQTMVATDLHKATELLRNMSEAVSEAQYLLQNGHSTPLHTVEMFLTKHKKHLPDTVVVELLEFIGRSNVPSREGSAATLSTLDGGYAYNNSSRGASTQTRSLAATPSVSEDPPAVEGRQVQLNTINLQLLQLISDAEAQWRAELYETESNTFRQLQSTHVETMMATLLPPQQDSTDSEADDNVLGGIRPSGQQWSSRSTSAVGPPRDLGATIQLTHETISVLHPASGPLPQLDDVTPRRKPPSTPAASPTAVTLSGTPKDTNDPYTTAHEEPSPIRPSPHLHHAAPVLASMDTGHHQEVSSFVTSHPFVDHSMGTGALQQTAMNTRRSSWASHPSPSPSFPSMSLAPRGGSERGGSSYSNNASYGLGPPNSGRGDLPSTHYNHSMHAGLQDVEDEEAKERMLLILHEDQEALQCHRVHSRLQTIFGYLARSHATVTQAEHEARLELAAKEHDEFFALQEYIGPVMRKILSRVAAMDAVHYTETVMRNQLISLEDSERATLNSTVDMSITRINAHLHRDRSVFDGTTKLYRQDQDPFFSFNTSSVGPHVAAGPATPSTTQLSISPAPRFPPQHADADTRGAASLTTTRMKVRESLSMSPTPLTSFEKLLQLTATTDSNSAELGTPARAPPPLPTALSFSHDGASGGLTKLEAVLSATEGI